MCTNIPHQAAILPNMGKIAWIKILKTLQSEFKKKKHLPHHPVTMVIWVIPWKIIVFVSAPRFSCLGISWNDGQQFQR